MLLFHLGAEAQSFISPDTVKVDGGLISGSLGKSGQVRIYKGVPFAAPPVGALRWKEPQPVEPWSGVLACTQFSASPMQGKPVPFLMYTSEFLIPAEPISEDCLYLNVWTGAKSAKEKRPVLVWIYGGGFTSGGSACPIYDGEALAKKGVVLVSINYRVGIFGFFAHPGLTAESPHHASGNYGLMDQLAALAWIKKNIAAFGGDPNNVTIAGQSAGAMSVNCLVASPQARGLFQKAIAESGAQVLDNPMMGQKSLADAEAAGAKLATSIEALRAIPADSVMKLSYAMRGVIVDGYVLPQSVPAIFREGKENDVPLITGWNADEGFLFGAPLKAEAYKKQVTDHYGAKAERILQLYPATDDSIAAISQLALSRDNFFGVQNYSWARMQAASGKSPVFVYRFNRKMPADGALAKYGAFHTAEVPYAFNNLAFVHRPFQPVDYLLADLMSSYWVNFARTGNPAGTGLPQWPAFTQKNNTILWFADKSEAMPMPDKANMDFMVELAGSSK